MNTIVKVLVFALSLIVVHVNAQDFQGVATYKSKRKIDIKLDSTQMNSEMHQKMMEMLKKQFEKTFILTFNKEESVYKEEEALESPQPAASGTWVVAVKSAGADVLYKNTKDLRYTNQNDLFGKIFLIKDKLEPTDWKLESETKTIGEYACFKATTTLEREKREGGISINGDKDLEADDKKAPKMETITITAWYTPQIPVSTGPGSYHGLPGLILEVNDGSETVICSKIVLNPENKVSISEPKKGKEVTQAEFDEILEKKMNEMENQYNSRRGDGQEIKIKIGN